MKTTTHVKDRKLQSGKTVSQFNKEVKMTISSMCPDKWLFVDLETGDVWHRREDEDNQKKAIGHFWRSANPQELKALKKLRTR